MSSPCDICLDQVCEGRRDCKCESCKYADRCHKRIGIKPTIRITRKCTQQCSHCVFSCSPKATEMMSAQQANKVATFCRANNIVWAEVMGGEFYMNPDWEEVLSILGKDIVTVRLVSNGDWANDEALSDSVIRFLSTHRQYYVGLSNDRWHTNAHVRQASDLLRDAQILHRVARPEETAFDGLIPLGRSKYEPSFYTMFEAACRREDRRYKCMIDEVGDVFKCPYGAIRYANVDQYQDGGFAARFVEFSRKFYRSGVMTCSQCARATSFLGGART